MLLDPAPPPPPAGVRDPGRYLDIVSDQEPAEVEHLQHGGRVVVYDAVALQDVLRARDLPGEPAEVKGRVAGQQVWQVAGSAAAAPAVILVAFHDAFHLSLLAIGSWQSTNGTQLRDLLTDLEAGWRKDERRVSSVF